MLASKVLAWTAVGEVMETMEDVFVEVVQLQLVACHLSVFEQEQP